MDGLQSLINISHSEKFKSWWVISLLVLLISSKVKTYTNTLGHSKYGNMMSTPWMMTLAWAKLLARTLVCKQKWKKYLVLHTYGVPTHIPSCYAHGLLLWANKRVILFPQCYAHKMMNEMYFSCWHRWLCIYTNRFKELNISFIPLNEQPSIQHLLPYFNTAIHN